MESCIFICVSDVEDSRFQLGTYQWIGSRLVAEHLMIFIFAIFVLFAFKDEVMAVHVLEKHVLESVARVQLIHRFQHRIIQHKLRNIFIIKLTPIIDSLIKFLHHFKNVHQCTFAVDLGFYLSVYCFTSRGGVRTSDELSWGEGSCPFLFDLPHLAEVADAFWAKDLFAVEDYF